MSKNAMNLTRLAAELTSRLQMPVSVQTIKNWQRRWSPPFPMPTHNGYYDIAECEARVREEYGKTGYAENADQLDLIKQSEAAVAEKKITSAERERWELEVEQGKYIERKLAEQTIIGTIKRYHGFVRTELEANTTAQRRDELHRLGVAPEIVAAFYSFDIALGASSVGRIEKECETAAGTGI